ncbi:iron chelate uptake ABC transporter family permease subunit [Campylobacter hyointestinalis]|uniref:iron chelate uptake ABC transporter family permease subunit n=1 Tax=Campylobacter hyointestinalis TaxID=198 RepID=UPI00215B8A23|nr:iron chelate uptake ABC transporter family permease subunit [Campylobacter hyointestinalis]
MKKNSFIFALLVIFSVISLINGKFDISMSEYLRVFTGIFSGEQIPASVIVLDIRLPRVIAAIIIGAALGVAGGAYQI